MPVADRVLTSLGIGSATVRWSWMASFSARSRRSVVAPSPCPGALRSPMPVKQAPQLCSLVDRAPDDADGWVSEIKFDGYRLLVAISSGTVRLLTRNGHDWSDRMPGVHAAFEGLRLPDMLLDGELVSLQADGVSSFPGLQASLKAGRDEALVFYAFDLLHRDGWDLRPCTLLDRKRVLTAAVPWNGMIRYSDHHQGQAQEMHASACGMHLEGIICKRADAPYRAGRGGSWLKLKCLGREEMIVLGWTPPAGSRVGIGALQLGYRDVDGGLHYAGGVGTGFSDSELNSLRARLEPLRADAPAGLLLAPGEPIGRGTVWVRPDLVAEVKYTGWSGAGRLRHPVYLGLREDKAAGEVIRAIADPEATRVPYQPGRFGKPGSAARKGWHGAVPPRQRIAALKTNSPVRRA